ncbi:MAG: vitamin B12-dependent ribonucleotide reductase, partial [Rhodospirillales bacterium]|nr:vitamin B12-dependent ribonucleotide reductase [Rhodospirillales bacterium]
TIKMATSILDYMFRELAVSYLGRNDLAHVEPRDLAPDSVGRGNDEGNLPEDADVEAFEVVNRFASQGFVRRNLLVLRGNGKGKGNGNGKGSGASGGNGGDHASEEAVSAAGFGLQAAADGGGLGTQTLAEDGAATPIALDSEIVAETDAKLAQRRTAKMQGYEGDSCEECGNFTLVRNGTCMKCMTCGATSGCS